MRIAVRIVAPAILLFAATVTGPGRAQQAELQVSLANTLAQEVNVYLAPADGSAPQFVGTMAAGASNLVQVKVGDQVILASGQEPFQYHAVTADPNQSVQIMRQAAAAPPAVTAAVPAPAQPPSAPQTSQPAQAAAPAPAAAGPGELMGPPDASGLRWQFLALSDPAKGPSGQLVYGIPQSDGVQAVASCTRTSPTIALDLSAPIQRLAAGSRTEVVFYLPGYESNPPGTYIEGFQGSLPGTVLAPKQGESITGFRVQVAGTSDGFWSVLQREGTLRYGRTATNELPLNGAKPIVDAFLAHCQSLGMPEAGVASAPARPGARTAPGCLSSSQLRSVEGAKLDVVFVNRSGQFRHVDWIDLSGTPVPVGGIQPGASLPVASADGYTFIVRDGPGNCIEIATTLSGRKQVVLNAKSRGFGRE